MLIQLKSSTQTLHPFRLCFVWVSVPLPWGESQEACSNIKWSRCHLSKPILALLLPALSDSGHLGDRLGFRAAVNRLDLEVSLSSLGSRFPQFPLCPGCRMWAIPVWGLSLQANLSSSLESFKDHIRLCCPLTLFF